MTPHFIKLELGRAFIHPCSICGDENAPYGYEVNLTKAIERRDVSFAGTWYCKEDKP